MIWFTSDTHFEHPNVIKYCNRNYLNVDEMHREMVRIWNNNIGQDDWVFHLGDFAFANEKHWFDQLNGKKMLIIGNHDRLSPTKYKKIGFKFAETKTIFILYGRKVLLSHYPYRPPIEALAEHSDLGHITERPVDGGLWLIHGHIHGCRGVLDKQINVSWDQWGKPLNINDIMELIDN